MSRRRLIIAVVVALAFTVGVVAFRHHHHSNADVWCVAPGEKVTPQFKKEYPDLLMPKAACDAWNSQ